VAEEHLEIGPKMTRKGETRVNNNNQPRARRSTRKQVTYKDDINVEVNCDVFASNHPVAEEHLEIGPKMTRKGETRVHHWVHSIHGPTRWDSKTMTTITTNREQGDQQESK
jgi:hypothetical protein